MYAVWSGEYVSTYHIIYIYTVKILLVIVYRRAEGFNAYDDSTYAYICVLFFSIFDFSNLDVFAYIGYFIYTYITCRYFIYTYIQYMLYI